MAKIYRWGGNNLQIIIVAINMTTTMEKDRILTPAVIAAVTFLHVGLVALLWHAHKPPMAEITHIEFIDLGSLGGGDGSPEGGGAPAAPEPPKPQPEPPKPKPKVEPPKPKPKPVEPEKPIIKPVVTKKAEADIQQPKEKPKPVEKPKPIEKPKPEPKPEVKPEPKPEVKPEPKPEPKSEPKAEKPVAKAEKPSEKSGGEAKNTEAGAKGSGGSGESKGSGKGSKGEGSGRGEGSGSGSGGKKGDDGDGKGGNGGGNEAGSSRSNPIKGGTCQIPEPSYPPNALESGDEGTVRLQVLAQPGGKIVSAKVIKSSGSASLDREARKAALKASCKASVWTEFIVPVSFTSK